MKPPFTAQCPQCKARLRVTLPVRARIGRCSRCTTRFALQENIISEADGAPPVQTVPPIATSAEQDALPAEGVVISTSGRSRSEWKSTAEHSIAVGVIASLVMLGLIGTAMRSNTESESSGPPLMVGHSYMIGVKCLAGDSTSSLARGMNIIKDRDADAFVEMLATGQLVSLEPGTMVTIEEVTLLGKARPSSWADEKHVDL